MQRPKNRYSTPTGKAPAKPAKVKKAKKAAVPLKAKLSRVSQARTTKREVRRFTKENPTGKYFKRAILGGLAFLVVLVLATTFTPILAIDKIVVSGESRVSEKQILKVLKKYVGTPLPTISEESVARDLKGFPIIESIALVSRPPHTLEVKITERTPIAIVVSGGVQYLYDPAGVKLGPASGSEQLPTVIVTGNPKDSATYRQAIDVILALPLQLLDRVAYIQAKTRDNVTLRLRGAAGQTVIWGDSSDSILKSKVLKTLLLKTSTKVRATYDVSSPLTPSVIN
ncbi:MAG: FtsQ-type POTRA domain-containing protein [Micrococcales bacterium]|nr:FtsQ-type POTRA domain-containing protein [Micrococcales bacterium]NBR77214.1 FtsQ-type POTRA domain-containing protein [Microbacteriaceae bacterium]NBS60588.1 FtsQ-type POTRA domain-containing protein [Microbacteriaceae bacterium]NBS85316.1 FtsQ-type POTRA domain-containing protein [Micrococcales bacterium]NBX94478.1 FtsQ-type POTRA domain-containing protein [Actinomycetota bacterium]